MSNMPPSSIHHRVQEKIQSGAVKPIPRWRFLLFNDVFWALVTVSIGLGGMAFSLAYLLLTQEEFDIFMRIPSHDGGIWIILLPLLWIVVLGVALVLAHINIRHTQYGYKIRALHLFGISMLLSVLFGGVLHLTQWNHSLDMLLFDHVPHYRNLREERLDFWARPHEGMLAGVIERVQTGALVLRSFDGTYWTVDISSVARQGRRMFPVDIPVRILGEMTGEGEFRAREVREWTP